MKGRHTEKNTQGECPVMTGRDWSDMFTSQGEAGMAGNPRSKEEGKEQILPLEPSERSWPY